MYDWINNDAEWLMARMEANEEYQHHLALDGLADCDDCEYAELATQNITIYNELNRRGYRWNNRKGEWEKA